MAASIHIDRQGEHQYVVHLRDDEEVGESWFNMTPSVLEQLHVSEADEEHGVRRTAEFLVERQGVADFPDIVERRRRHRGVRRLHGLHVVASKPMMSQRFAA
jgi:hypothetical protein